MRLRLERIDGPHAGEARAIDGSAAFSVSTDHGATWQLRGATGPARIDLRRGPSGFEVEASGMVTIEGQPVPDGATIALGRGSRIGLGDAVLRTSITQEAASGLAGSFAQPSGPTVNAILSDVSPGGDTAQGPLPGRSAEDWLASITKSQGAVPQEDRSRISAFGHAIRMALDPSTAPQATQTPLATYLPENWNAPSDDLNRIFQADIASGATTIGISDAASRDPIAPREAHATRAALPLADRTQREQVGLPPERRLAVAEAALGVALAGIRRLEEAMQRLREMLDLPHRGETDPVIMDPALMLSDEDGLCLNALARRIDLLERAQIALIDGVRVHLAQARHAFDPEDILSAATSRARFMGRRKAAAWAEYRTRWSPVPPAVSPLSDEALARAIAAAESGQDPEASDP